MSIKQRIAKQWAKRIVKTTKKWADNPIKTQQKVLMDLIKTAKNTAFGRDHDFESINNYDAFQSRVPINDYEGLRPYVDRMVAGEADVLWQGKPLYFSKTSGTTSGVKYIPITKESMPTHIKTAQNALFHYIHNSGDASFVDGKLIFLQGSPILSKTNGIATGRLSGIVAHYVPSYLQRSRMPSWQTNCIEDWEQKVGAIVDETVHEDMRLISGIPPWVKMYFERLKEKSGKSISELFPNFSLFVYGGVNYEPYRNALEELIGKKVDSVELYPASEGFIAFQDQLDEKGMLLQLNTGIFYEFIEADKIHEENPPRISLADVKIGVNYAIILNTSAGLWGYNIGDTVEFVSLDPYRIIVSGRIKHFISAFGEHVIGKEVEQAMKNTVKKHQAHVSEFTVAPQVTPDEGLPHHEWWVAFDKPPIDLATFATTLDTEMRTQNTYYDDLISGGVLRPLVLRVLPADAFEQYMKSIGKLGGQNKTPRLTNDRKIADSLSKLFQIK
ncbi:MAG: GH3 auxin-responsive promoter family protein [Bacteroidetes bacterium]|nr:GH3 auxin-responsive promoter family protein [Bacteroidota bacterium]MDA0888894.1 GH3 auxin-responsive promoter family protein [Bacteroidota bacterium]MDA1084679.1 GH3 auxin-responsive promoter family protein [Bacteroidota bacterium]